MEFKELLLQAFISLRKNLMRTLLTMLGIIIGITAVILIVSIGQGAVKFITSQLTSFGTNYFSINPGTSVVSQFAGGEKNLTREDADAIDEDPSLTNIESVVPLAAASAKVSANGESGTYLIYGVTALAQNLFKPEITSGDFITEDDELGHNRVAVIGIDVVEKFFGQGADPVGENIRIGNKPFRVIGVAKSSSTFFGGFFNNSFYLPINVVSDQILGSESLQEIDISVKNTNTINQTIDDVTALLRERHDLEKDEENDFIIQSFQDALTTVQTITNLLTVIIAAISGISLVVGGVGVMNIMLVTVTERTREIGLLKSIGAKQRDILTQFLMEAVVITIIGGIIGIILGISGALIISLLVGIPFVISIPSIVIGVLVAAGVGIVFGLYPARRAAKLQPVDAMRYE